MREHCQNVPQSESNLLLKPSFELNKTAIAAKKRTDTRRLIKHAACKDAPRQERQPHNDKL